MVSRDAAACKDFRIRWGSEDSLKEKYYFIKRSIQKKLTFLKLLLHFFSFIILRPLKRDKYVYYIASLELYMLNGWHVVAYNGKAYNIFTCTIVNKNDNIRWSKEEHWHEQSGCKYNRISYYINIYLPKNHHSKRYTHST